MITTLNILLTIGTKYWKLIGAVLVLVFTTLFFEHQRSIIIEQQASIIKLEAEKSLLVNNQTALTSALGSIHDSIDVLASASAESARQMQLVSSQMATRTNQLATGIKRIQEQPVPTTCDDAIKYMLQSREGYPK